jgi:hypothetical protein
MESIEVTFNGQADFNKRVTAVINRNADLMYRTYVQVVLPAVDFSTVTQLQRFRWLSFIGHRLIKTVELEIGGQRIDRQYGDWMQIWTQLSQDQGTIDAGSIGAKHGELGHTQFLPGNAFEYGLDGNGDGRIDLNNAVDALATTANFLRAKGWQAGAGYGEGQPNFAVLNEWNAATVYQQAIALIAAKIDG